MLVAGSLLQDLITNSDTTAVICIDEHAGSTGATDVPGNAQQGATTTDNQRRTIATAQRLGCPIILVEYNFAGNLAAGITTAPLVNSTRTTLRAMLPLTNPVVTKHQPNAFSGTGLHQYLQANHPGITRLLVMGFHANACVAATAGIFDFFAALNPGATHHNYEVTSCDAVLNGGPATWGDNQAQACRNNIHFYNAL